MVEREPEVLMSEVRHGQGRQGQRRSIGGGGPGPLHRLRQRNPEVEVSIGQLGVDGE